MLLIECHRVLRPDGVYRFVVPDLANAVKTYCEAKQRGDENAADALMQGILVHDKARPRSLQSWYHRLTAFHQQKWMYDEDSLQTAFREAGFNKPRAAAYLDSHIDRIDEVEHPGRIVDGEGVAVEASED